MKIHNKQGLLVLCFCCWIFFTGADQGLDNSVPAQVRCPHQRSFACRTGCVDIGPSDQKYLDINMENTESHGRAWELIFRSTGNTPRKFFESLKGYEATPHLYDLRMSIKGGRNQRCISRAVCHVKSDPLG